MLGKKGSFGHKASQVEHLEQINPKKTCFVLLEVFHEIVMLLHLNKPQY